MRRAARCVGTIPHVVIAVLMPGALVPRGALAVSLGLLTACAPGGAIYDKPGATYAEWRRDDAACRQAVTVTEGARDTLDRQAYIRCMRERGYRIRAE